MTNIPITKGKDKPREKISHSLEVVSNGLEKSQLPEYVKTFTDPTNQ